MMSARCAVGCLLGGLLVLFVLAACGEGHVQHPPRFPGGAVEPTGEGLTVEIGGTEVLEDHECLVCHGVRDDDPDADDAPPYVDGHGYLATAHARKDVACELCHEEQTKWPHPKDADLLAVQCGDCHDDKLEAEGDDVHVRLEGMDPEELSTTKTCIGCHRAHTLRLACIGCHDAKWKTNFERRDLGAPHDDLVFHHGERNRWCLDCHDAENREGFRLANGTHVDPDESHRLCGQCHGTKFRDWGAGVHGRRTGRWPSGEAKKYRLCIQCHDPHSPRFEPIEPEPTPVRPEHLRRAPSPEGEEEAE